MRRDKEGFALLMNKRNLFEEITAVTASSSKG
ncbi:hypothetical protein N480_18665 [Pseudoalteromonas luteoviolacea S2607]|nr:hypothetical protein N480_18665 [Pseudoalteromonas luteoviolacea S2607]